MPRRYARRRRYASPVVIAHAHGSDWRFMGQDAAGAFIRRLRFSLVTLGRTGARAFSPSRSCGRDVGWLAITCPSSSTIAGCRSHSTHISTTHTPPPTKNNYRLTSQPYQTMLEPTKADSFRAGGGGGGGGGADGGAPVAQVRMYTVHRLRHMSVYRSLELCPSDRQKKNQNPLSGDGGGPHRATAALGELRRRRPHRGRRPCGHCRHRGACCDGRDGGA